MLLRAVCAAVAPPPSTALSLLQRRSEPLRTGLPALDAHLGGGLPICSITELVGPAGVGKTQLCHAVVARALVQGAASGVGVLYLDSERSFKPERLLQLLRDLLAREPAAAAAAAAVAPMPSPAGLPLSAEALLASRVRVLQPAKWDEYAAHLAALGTDLLHHPANLLIVDSVAAPVRAKFPAKEDVVARHEALAGHAAMLKRLASSHQLCVLVSNQVFTASSSHGHAKAHAPLPPYIQHIHGREDSLLSACLGNTWAHCVNTRLVLQYERDGSGGTWGAAGGGTDAGSSTQLHVTKSAMCGAAAFSYAVGASGLEAR